MSSNSINDLNRRHCLREKGKCKIKGCKQRGRYNYGKEYFYHGFCKDHYSLYQEGIIDFKGNQIRPKRNGCKDWGEYKDLREPGKRWNKKDHVDHNFRCKIVGCERHGEKSHGKEYYFKGFCSYHYREWFLKGFIDEEGNIVSSLNKGINNAKISRKMIKYYKKIHPFLY